MIFQKVFLWGPTSCIAWQFLFLHEPWWLASSVWVHVSFFYGPGSVCVLMFLFQQMLHDIIVLYTSLLRGAFLPSSLTRLEPQHVGHTESPCTSWKDQKQDAHLAWLPLCVRQIRFVFTSSCNSSFRCNAVHCSRDLSYLLLSVVKLLQLSDKDFFIWDTQAEWITLYFCTAVEFGYDKLIRSYWVARCCFFCNFCPVNICIWSSVCETVAQCIV